MGVFFTPLDLLASFKIYDLRTAVSERKFVPPSFNDIRSILNMAQVLALRTSVRLITFDGDQTLYEDGKDFAHESPLAQHIIALILKGVDVALVTAAGYKGQPQRYEQRLRGLLSAMSTHKLEQSVLNHFFVMGGECNYLFRCVLKADGQAEAACGLEEIDPALWKEHSKYRVHEKVLPGNKTVSKM